MRLKYSLQYLLAASLMTVTVASVQAQQPAAAAAQLKAGGIEINAERLVQFAAQGDIAVLNQLIEAGVDVKQAEPKRQVTALHNAAAQGHKRIVLRLLELGADVNAADWYGVTPLITAAIGGHSEIAQILLQKGADPNRSPAQAPTALIAAIWRDDPALLELLLNAGAKPDLADGLGRTPLAAAKQAKRAQLVTRIETALAKGKS